MGNHVMDVVAALVRRRSYQTSGFQQGGSRSFCVGEELVSGKGGRRTSNRRKGLSLWLVGSWILLLQLTHCNFPSYVGALSTAPVLGPVFQVDEKFQGIGEQKRQPEKTLLVSHGIGKLKKQQQKTLLVKSEDTLSHNEHTLPVQAGGNTIALLETLVGATLPDPGKSMNGVTSTFIPYDWSMQMRQDSLGNLLRNMHFFQTIIHAILEEALERTKEPSVLALYVGKDYLILFAKRRILTTKSLPRRILRSATGLLNLRDEADTVPQALLDQMDMHEQMVQATTLNKCTLAYVVVLKEKELNHEFVKNRIYPQIPKELLRSDVQHGTCVKVQVSQELISELLPGAISLHDLPI